MEQLYIEFFVDVKFKVMSLFVKRKCWCGQEVYNFHSKDV